MERSIDGGTIYAHFYCDFLNDATYATENAR